MRYKPWPIIILSAVLFLMPFVNTILNALYLGVDLRTYLAYYFSVREPHQIFAFFFMLPIAGIAVFMVKRWSYPVFLAAIVWVLADNVWSWRVGLEIQRAIWVYFVIIVGNVAVASYYLLPTVRRVYFDRTLRWWESKPRFLVSLPGTLVCGDTEMQMTLRDFSLGGAFVITGSATDAAATDAAPIRTGEEVEFRLSVSNFSISVPARVVYESNDVRSGYGLQFLPDSAAGRKIHRFVRALRILGLEPARDPSSIGNFREWVSGLARGKGWLPEV